MYSRSGQGRFPRDLRVPKNYAGNAFRPPFAEKEQPNPIFIDEEGFEEPEMKSPSPSIEDAQDTAPIKTPLSSETPNEAEEKNDTRQTGIFSFPRFDIGLGKIFSQGGLNVGFEELLLLGLILLIASEGKGDDLILLLILLLFIR